MLILEWPKTHFAEDDEKMSRTIYAWRGAIQYPSSKQISVCLDGFIIAVERYTIKDWLEASEYIGKEERKVVECRMFDGMPMCGNCFGSGKLDWVRRVKNKPKKIHGIHIGDSEYIPFFPDEKLCISDDGRRVQYLPKLFEEEKYCPFCGAIGIAFQGYKKMFKDKLWYQSKFPFEE